MMLLRASLVGLCLPLAIFVGCKTVGKKQKFEAVPMMDVQDPRHSDVRGEGFLPLCRKHIEIANDIVADLIDPTKSRPFLSTLELYNEILIHLDSAMSQSSLLSQVHPDPQIRKDAETCEL